MLEIIDESVEHANKIVDNLLEYSKEITLEIEECSPKSMMDYILLMAQIPTRIRILDRTYDEPTIWVDTGKIETVFINIIKNAIDATPEEGLLEVSSKQIDKNVEFTSDTGIGLSEQTLQRFSCHCSPQKLRAWVLASQYVNES